MTRSTGTALIVSATLLMLAPPLAAQGVFDMGVLTNTLSMDHVTEAERARRGKPAAPPASPPPASYRYRAPSTPPAVATAYREILAGTGLREDDAGDAMAAYTVIGWLIANNHAAEPPAAAPRSVRAQLAPTLARNPDLADPRRRAAMGEYLKAQVVALNAGWRAGVASGDRRAYSDSIAARFRASGLDLRALSLTTAGFKPR